MTDDEIMELLDKLRTIASIIMQKHRARGKRLRYAQILLQEIESAIEGWRVELEKE